MEKNYTKQPKHFTTTPSSGASIISFCYGYRILQMLTLCTYHLLNKARWRNYFQQSWLTQTEYMVNSNCRQNEPMLFQSLKKIVIPIVIRIAQLSIWVIGFDTIQWAVDTTNSYEFWWVGELWTDRFTFDSLYSIWGPLFCFLFFSGKGFKQSF